MPEPWHYRTLLDALDHWQSLIAGAFGFIAAIFVVWFTLRAEQRKTTSEIQTLRKSIGVEVRDLLLSVHSSFLSLRNLTESGAKITSRMIANSAHFGVSVVYPASADRIGQLGPVAMRLAMFYGRLDMARTGIGKAIDRETPNDVPPIIVASLAELCISTCVLGLEILPATRTGVIEFDRSDENVTKIVQKTAAAWETTKQQKWPALIQLAAEAFTNVFGEQKK